VRAEHRHPWCASITTGEATQLLYPGVSHVCGPESRKPWALSLVHTMVRHMDAVAWAPPPPTNPCRLFAPAKQLEPWPPLVILRPPIGQCRSCREPRTSSQPPCEFATRRLLAEAHSQAPDCLKAIGQQRGKPSRRRLAHFLSLPLFKRRHIIFLVLSQLCRSPLTPSPPPS
jgi:hypothetical protein